MRKLRTLLCILLLCLLIPSVLALRGRLPMDPQPLIEKKYGGWAGTLRLWVCEGWQVGAGSVAGWLNRCIAGFEKAHPGVYIQTEYVKDSDLRSLCEDGMLPPDMILFPPAVMEDADHLLPMDADDRLRPELRQAGCVGESRLAVPVAMGGYLWAYNVSKLSAIPGSWREAELMPSVPGDEPHHLWSAALLGLCSRRYTESTSDTPSGELELGLATGIPDPTAAPVDEGLPCQLPEGFLYNENAWQDFINGEAAALLVGQREVRRLEALDGQGRGPDWRLAGSDGNLFNDQLLYLGIVDRGSEDDRVDLCRRFAEHLLGDGCQGELWRAGAFSVTGVPSGYSSGDALAIMDASLQAAALAPVPAFGSAWREAAQAIVRKYTDSNGDSAALFRELRGILSEKSEH